jgi:hypothetical protein
MADPSDYFILSIPTHDGRAVPKSIMDLMSVAAILKRQFLLNVQTGTGIANTRQKCTDTVKTSFPDEKNVYIFWLDSDILLMENPKKIADYIVEAENRGLSFTTNYLGIDSYTGKTFNTAMKGDTENYAEYYTDKELKNAKPFELKCAYSGFGIGYIKTPLDYKFKTIGHEQEDFLFFKDNKTIDLRYVPISNVHIKTVNLVFDHTNFEALSSSD